MEKERNGERVNITNNYYGPIGQKIDHVDTVNFRMDGDGEFHFGNVGTVKGAEAQPEVPSWERLAVAMRACRNEGLMWSQSAYAVFYRVIDEDYGLTSSRGKFEERMSLLGFADCTPGTLDNAFRHNPFLYSPTAKWPQAEGRNKQGAVLLAEALRRKLAP